MQKIVYIHIILLFAALTACSGDSENDRIPEGTGEEVILSAGYSTAVEAVPTKADPKDFTEAFDLYYKQTAGKTIDSNYQYKDITADAQKKYNLGIYWDNIGGNSAAFELLGLHPKNTVFTATNLSDNIDWPVATDQSGDGYADSDLLVSDLVSDYTLVKQKANTKMLFRHVMSKITLQIIPGEGFNSKFLSEPTVTLKGLETIATVNAKNLSAVEKSLTSSKSDVTPKTETDNNIKTAIVIPKQEFATGYTIAELTVDDNDYVIKLSEDLTLQQGKNHILKVTVNKTGISVQASIKDWEIGSNISSAVKLKLEPYSLPNGGEEPKLNSLFFMKVGGKTNNYIYNGQEWQTQTLQEIYWDDINTSSSPKANAVLFNCNTSELVSPYRISDYPDSIYTGESQELDKHYDFIGFGNMKHPFSKVIIKILSDYSSPDSVTLTNIKKVSLAGLKKFSEVITDATSSDYLQVKYESTADSVVTVTNEKLGSATIGATEYKAYEMTMFVEDGKSFAETDKLMTVNVISSNGVSDIENNYVLHVPSGQSISFVANKNYTITAILSKTSVALNISIVPWDDDTDPIEGGATIEE